MKITVTIFFLLGYFLLRQDTANAQNLSIGFSTGVNYSDIHGNKDQGKWPHNPGPVQEISLNYSVNSILSFETGIDLATVYYEYLPFYHKTNPPQYLVDSYSYSSCSSCIMPPYWPTFYYFGDKMDFSFIRIPVSLKLTFPAKPVFTVSAGAFYAILQDCSTGIAYSEKPEKYDLGFKLSAGFQFPVTDKFDFGVKGNYIAGKRTFMPDLTFRHGESEILFGITWSGISKKSEKPEENDSLNASEKFKLIYTGGLNISGNNFKYPGKKYLYNYGLSAGFLADYIWNPKSSIRTGLLFERTGYSMRDSSDLFYRYGSDGNLNYYLKTAVSIDYIDLPLLLTFYYGKSNNIYFGLGPYIGWKLNARCTGKAYSENRSGTSYTAVLTTVYDDIERLVKGMDSGYILFAGITFPFCNRCLLDAGIRYRHGGRNVFRGSGEPGYADTEFKVIKNETLTIQTGLRVPLFIHGK